MAHMVFVGAGHGHLPVLKQAGRFRRAGHEITLVAPADFRYSGMVTGVLAGDYTAQAHRVDIAAFAESHGIARIDAGVTALDPAARRLQLSNGGEIGYDLLSLAVGSRVRALEGGEKNSSVYSVKPLTRLLELKQRLEAQQRARLAIIGGGLAGCEIALCLKGALPDLRLSLFTRRAIVPRAPRAAPRLRALFERRGIALYEHTHVTELQQGVLHTKAGHQHPFELALLATGLEAPAFIRDSGLGVDDDGALMVNEYLQSPDDPHIFAIGDCMSFAPRRLDKAGVYAIRGAPVLAHNLMAQAAGKPLRPFTPQERYLWIMNLGGRQALASREPWLWQGRSAWWLKDMIDRRFMRSLQP